MFIKFLKLCVYSYVWDPEDAQAGVNLCHFSFHHLTHSTAQTKKKINYTYSYSFLGFSFIFSTNIDCTNIMDKALDWALEKYQYTEDKNVPLKCGANSIMEHDQQIIS